MQRGLGKTVKRRSLSRIPAMSREEAHTYLARIATDLGLDQEKADLKSTREILSKGTPLSRLIIEMRER